MANTANTARKNEANPEAATPITFQYDGETYEVVENAVDNLELFEFIEDEKFLKATKGFLGQAQWDKFKDTHRTEDGRVPMAPVEGFLQELMNAIGSKNS